MSAAHFTFDETSSGPFDEFDLESLLAGAARMRPDHQAIIEVGGDIISFADMQRQCIALSATLRDTGLKTGARVLILAQPRNVCLIALLAGLHAGLDVIMAPAYATQEELSHLCQSLQPQAVLTCAKFEDEDLVALAFKSAIATRSISLIACLDQHVSGAAYFAPHILLSPAPEARPPLAIKPHIITITPDMSAHRHAQKLLIAAGLNYISRAHIGMQHKIFNLLSPTSLAGLMGGVVASLLSGASLILQPYFNSALFQTALTDHRPVHVLAPMIMHPMLQAAGLINRAHLYSLSLHHRGSYEVNESFASDVLCLILNSNTQGSQLTISAWQRAQATAQSTPPMHSEDYAIVSADP